jgi:hypothetical protein
MHARLCRTDEVADRIERQPTDPPHEPPLDARGRVRSQKARKAGILRLG